MSSGVKPVEVVRSTADLTADVGRASVVDVNIRRANRKDLVRLKTLLETGEMLTTPGSLRWLQGDSHHLPDVR